MLVIKTLKIILDAWGGLSPKNLDGESGEDLKAAKISAAKSLKI